MDKYNEELANKLTKLDLEDYAQSVHATFYSSMNIDYMDYLLSLCNKTNEFVVEQEKLSEFGVLAENASVEDIKKLFSQYHFADGTDYTLYTVANSKKNKNQNKSYYMLTPYAFKICLMRANINYNYAKYYLLIEKVLYSYINYEKLYKDKITEVKDDQMSSLVKELKSQVIESKKLSLLMNHQSSQVKELIDITTVIKEQNNNIINSITETTDAINETRDTVMITKTE